MAQEKLTTKTIHEEFELYCPVCEHSFKQLVVLHKVPEDFDLGAHLQGMVERHDHKSYQEWKSRQLG